MVDGRKESVETLRIHKQRTTRDKWLLPMPGQTESVSDYRRVWILSYLKPHDWIFIE